MGILDSIVINRLFIRNIYLKLLIPKLFYTFFVKKYIPHSPTDRVLKHYFKTVSFTGMLKAKLRIFIIPLKLPWHENFLYSVLTALPNNLTKKTANCNVVLHSTLRKFLRFRKTLKAIPSKQNQPRKHRFINLL